MGVTTASGIYLPTISPPESYTVWPIPFNQGLLDHEAHRSHRSLTVARLIYDVDHVNGSDAHSSDVIGWDDYPYQNLQSAVAAIPNINTNAATGVWVRLRGSNSKSPDNAIPDQTYGTGGGTVVPPEYMWLMGTGADADRQRASCLIQDTVPGNMIEPHGRYVTLQNVGVSNLSTAVGSAGVGYPTTNPGGGMQGARWDRLACYSCRRGLVLRTFNIDNSLGIQCAFQRNRAEGLVLEADNAGNSPNLVMFLQSDFSNNNTDAVAGVPNILAQVNDSGGDSGNVLTMLGWKCHGPYTKTDLQGWHLATFAYGYIESNQQYADDESAIKIRRGLGGSTSRHYTMHPGYFRNRFHGVSAQNPNAWTRGRGRLLDGDEVIGLRFRENAIEFADATTSNPVVKLGPNTWDAVVEFGAGVSNTGDHSTLETDPQKLIFTTGRKVTDGVMTIAVANLTSATAAFTANDIGKVVFVGGAGGSGRTLRSHIVSITSATVAVLQDVAIASTSGATVEIEGGGGRVRGSYYDHTVHLTKEFGTLETKWVSAEELSLDGSGSAKAVEGTAPHAKAVVDLRDGQSDGVMTSWYLRKEYTERAVVYATIYWIPDSTPGASRSVNWQFDAHAVADDDNQSTVALTTTAFTGVARSFTNHKTVIESRVRVLDLTSDTDRAFHVALKRDGVGDSFAGVVRLYGILLEVVGPNL